MIFALQLEPVGEDRSGSTSPMPARTTLRGMLHRSLTCASVDAHAEFVPGQHALSAGEEERQRDPMEDLGFLEMRGVP